MGTQFWTGSRVSLRLTELPFLSNLKACPLPSVSTTPSVTRPMALEVPAVPGAEAVIRAQENIIVGNNSPLAALPGIEAHAAAEAAVKESNRPGFSAHSAAENAVLLSQGRIPAGVPAAHLAHFQAEQAVRLAAGF